MVFVIETNQLSKRFGNVLTIFFSQIIDATGWGDWFP
jgi:hypothetical protein